VSELSQYIATSTSSQENLAKFRTEWWYRVLYPFSLLVLMLFALLQGARTDRRNALGGIMLSILVLIGFIFTTQFFIAFGAHDRLPPFVAVVASEVIFGAVGLHMLARSNGWWWQLLEVGRRLKKEHWDEEEEPA
jgi:lipopolysaccharide export LptBFGC system permease protein LptF